MNDILPPKSAIWQRIEAALREIAAAYCYQEIRFPVIEQTALFTASIGKSTDIVEKEMYTFHDRNDESLSLRPEGTAGCVRAGIQHGLLYNQTQRLWYQGPMFRRERPQKGRYRQFYQFGVEAFGMPGPDVDAEQIFMNARLWELLGIKDRVVLQINSLGNPKTRDLHRAQLVAYFTEYLDALDADSRRRLVSNPLRILDSKVPDMQHLIEGAPQLLHHLDDEAQAHFDGLRRLLDVAGLAYEVNPRLVRGLDYYGLTVYEWVTSELGAQGTISAGGRYDELVGQRGGQSTPAVGFAIGLERVVELVETVMTPSAAVDAYLIMLGDEAVEAGLVFADRMRTEIPGLRLMANCGGGNLKKQFKRADKSGARYALVLGEEELAAQKVAIKFLREDRPQELVEQASVSDYFKT